MSSLLPDALLLWYGLVDLCFWIVLRPDQLQKTVTYTDDEQEAACCFSSSVKSCPPDTCKMTAGSCVPTRASSTWWTVGAQVNARPTGRLFTLCDTIHVQIATNRNVEHYISFLEPSTAPNQVTVVVFPSGLHKMCPVPVLDKVCDVVRKYVDRGQNIVLCGHSMGASWAQMVALALVEKNIAVDNVCVVGAGAFKWATPKQARVLWQRYKTRWTFFVNSELKGTERLIDEHVRRNGSVQDKHVLEDAIGLPSVLLEPLQLVVPAWSSHAWANHRVGVWQYITSHTPENTLLFPVSDDGSEHPEDDDSKVAHPEGVASESEWIVNKRYRPNNRCRTITRSSGKIP